MLARTVLAVLITCSLWPAPAVAAAPKSLIADRVEVRLALAGDGSVDVTETAAFRFVGGPFTSVARRLSTRNTDGIADIAAAVDGEPFPVGRQAGNIRIEREDGVTVTWRLGSLSDTSRTLTLHYRVRGATRRENGADVLQWRALPVRRSYEVGATTVLVSWPDCGPLAGIPRVSNGAARMSDDGRHATIVATGSLPPEAGLNFELAFAPGCVAQQVAAWQARQDRGRAAAPAISMGAGAILLAGVSWIFVFWIGHRREPLSHEEPAERADPPDELSIGLAGALMEPGGAATWSEALATMVDLAGRGIVRIEEQPGRTWQGSREYVIHLVSRPSGLRSHEAGLLDLLFVSKGGSVTSIKLSAAGRAAQSHLKLYKAPVADELVEAGLVSPERARTRAALVRWGILLVVVAVTGFIGAAFLASSYGGWPMLVPGAVVVVAVTILVLASGFSVLSTAGSLRAGSWRGFFTFVRRVAKGQQPIGDPAWFGKYLPFAVARNVGRDWVRTFEKSGRVAGPPSWFTRASASPGHRTPLGGFADMLSRARAAGVVKHGSA